MASPSIHAELNKYLSLLTPMQQASVLSLIKSFIQPETNSQRISIEQYNKEIAEAMAEAAAGNYITQEEMEKEAASW
jgi:predicted transcriptional regulator